jgi:hypothetical protein
MSLITEFLARRFPQNDISISENCCPHIVHNGQQNPFIQPSLVISKARRVRPVGSQYSLSSKLSRVKFVGHSERVGLPAQN